MAWEVEYTNEFEAWWNDLSGSEQNALNNSVELLIKHGPLLAYPYSSGIFHSKHDHMRELRQQHAGRPLRILYAFDQRRTAILLIGGDKTGNDHWYKTYIPIADHIYDEYIDELKKEGSMAKKFEELRTKMSPESRAESEAAAQKILDEKFPLSIENLRSQMEVMGGQLQLVARFPDGVVKTFDLSDYSRIL